MKTIEVKIYFFDELTTAAQQIAIDQARNRKYEDSDIEQWIIDDCYLFEPKNAVMERLFGEANGYNRLRLREINLSQKTDFTQAISL